MVKTLWLFLIGLLLIAVLQIPFVKAALDYNDTDNDKVVIANATDWDLAQGTSFSILAWYRTDDVNEVVILGHDNFGGNNPKWGWSFGIEGAGAWHFTQGGAGDVVNVGTDTQVAGEWRHVALTYNGSTNDYIRYINGVSQTTTNDASAISNNDRVLTIGWLESGCCRFNGQLDDVSIFNGKLLTQAEIQTYMFRRMSSNEDGVDGYWRLDEPSPSASSTIADFTVNARNGEAGSGILTSSSSAPIMYGE